jgi:hypothetical protein
MYHCPLCGFNFDKGESVPCKSCPIGAATCNLLCCPNCGYQWPEESKVVSALRKLFGKKEVRVEEKN